MLKHSGKISGHVDHKAADLFKFKLYKIFKWLPVKLKNGQWACLRILYYIRAPHVNLNELMPRLVYVSEYYTAEEASVMVLRGEG